MNNHKTDSTVKNRIRSILAGTILILSIQACASSGPAGNQQSYEEVPMQEDLFSEEFPRPDVMAKYPGGKRGVTRHFVFNTDYPYRLYLEDVEGRVLISYVIDEEGNVEDIEALMSPHEDITKMFIKAASSMEKWQPAMLNGKPVKQKYLYVTRFQKHENIKPDSLGQI